MTNETTTKQTTDRLPVSYHWNRSQSFLAAGCAVAFAGVAGLAYVIGDVNQPDVNALCAPDNEACHRYVEEKAQQDKIFLSGMILVIGGGIGMSRASRFYRRAEEIKQDYEGQTFTL